MKQLLRLWHKLRKQLSSSRTLRAQELLLPAHAKTSLWPTPIRRMVSSAFMIQLILWKVWIFAVQIAVINCYGSASLLGKVTLTKALRKSRNSKLFHAWFFLAKLHVESYAINLCWGLVTLQQFYWCKHDMTIVVPRRLITSLHILMTKSCSPLMCPLVNVIMLYNSCWTKLRDLTIPVEHSPKVQALSWLIFTLFITWLFWATIEYGSSLLWLVLLYFHNSGMYWVDPNAGSPVDAIEVYCDIKQHQTCVLPKPSQVRLINNIPYNKTVCQCCEIVPISLNPAAFIHNNLAYDSLADFQKCVVSGSQQACLVWRRNGKWFPSE